MSRRRRDLVEQANEVVSIFDVLHDEFGIDHPREGRSYKGHCLGGETEILTEDGPQRLDAGARAVVVWDGTGWVEGKVRSFGRQPLNSVTLRPLHRARAEKWTPARTLLRATVRATPDHRWFTERGLVRDLRPGDVVPAWAAKAEATPEGIVAGFVYGDGEKRNAFQEGGSSLYHAPLHGLKDAELRVWLAMLPELSLHARIPHSDDAVWFAGWTTKSDLPGVPVARVRSWRALKDLPDAPPPGFIEGWCMADAWEAPDGTQKLFAQERDLGWLERHAAAQGFILTGMVLRSGDTNKGVRRPSAEFSLARGERAWRVESVVAAGEEEVWCATTLTGALTLARGIATGNCPFGFEHPDGGVEKGFRSYPGSNTGYCFVMHGQLTPVRLVALQQDWSQRRSAEWLLRKAGKLDARPWPERWNEMEREKAIPASQDLGDPQVLVEALHESLRDHPAYPPGGLSPRLSEALEARLAYLERLRSRGATQEAVEAWYETSKATLRQVLDEEAASVQAG